MNRRIGFLGIVFAWASLGTSQSIVYDNTTTSLNNNFPLLPEAQNDSVEVGDEIWLAGSSREIVEIRLLFTNRGTAPNTFDARIRFRDLDATFNPAEIIYDSGIVTSIQSLPGITEHVFAVPSVAVPDRFVWTVQVFNRQGPANEIGPSYFNPPTVGSSEDFFWRIEQGGEWTPYSWGGDPFANFGARVTAVPEPSTLVAITFGALALTRKRKRN